MYRAVARDVTIIAAAIFVWLRARVPVLGVHKVRRRDVRLYV